MATYDAWLVGTSPILMNLMSEEQLEQIGGLTPSQPQLKGTGLTKHDLAAPKIYRDGEQICMPVVNLLAALAYAGRFIKYDGKQISTATTTRIFMMMGIPGEMLPLLIHDGNAKFHVATDEDWMADLRRGTSNNLKGGGAVPIIRPKFENWALKVPVWINDKEFPLETIQELFRYAGLVSGLCDFRPNKNGNFGMFRPVNWVETQTLTVEEDIFTSDNVKNLVFEILDFSREVA